MDRKIWIVGAGGFAFDLASRFVQVPGEGNVFSGFIDSRAEVVEDTKGVYEKYKDRMTAEFLSASALPLTPSIRSSQKQSTQRAGRPPCQSRAAQ